MTEMRMGPSFLCIGAPRAGTSWLYRNIKIHPDTWMPPIKELHYFDALLPALPLIVSVFDHRTYVVRQAVLERLCKSKTWQKRRRARWLLRFLLLPRTNKWYLSLFLPSQGRITGDITPGYSFMEASRVTRAHALIPDVRIIYLLRNPITQMWSWAALHFDLWHHQRLENIDRDRLETYLDKKSQTHIPKHLENLETWIKSYPEEQVFVGFYDQLAENPYELLQNIYKFLGLDSSDKFIPETVYIKRNMSQYPPLPDHFARYLTCQYYDQIAKLHQRFSNRYTANWLDFANERL
jgi:hypothetical protein